MYKGSAATYPSADELSNCMQTLPEAPTELVAELSRRYIILFEKITGQQFQPAANGKGTNARIADNVWLLLRRCKKH